MKSSPPALARVGLFGWWFWLCLVLAACCDSRALNAQLNSVRVGTGFTQPLFATYAPGATQQNNLYVVEKTGAIKSLNLSTGVTSPFLNLAALEANLQTDGEEGLLGLAFHPNFATNGQFYISYTVGATGTRNTRVERYTANSGVVDTGSRQTVLEFALPVSNNNHNGGWLGFSPVNNFLYISTGDGGPTPANSQNLNNLMGKMLRIDVNSVGANDTGGQYAIPAGNPFAGPTAGMAEIWSYGLRNPWRNSFDRANGNLWIGDVGQGTREEVNFQAAGSSAVANYGWNFREGTLGGTIPPNNVDPIYEYDLGVSQAITGGYVYRGGNILDGGVSLDGTYFFADYQTNRIFSFRYNGSTLTNFQERTSQLQTANLGTVQFIASFGEDALGRLYMLDLVGGEVFRIEGAAIPEPGTIAACSVLALGMLWRWKARRAAT